MTATSWHPTATTSIDDTELVWAPRWLVHRRLADVDAWPRWWPGWSRLSLQPDGPGGPNGGPTGGRGGQVAWIHHVEVAVRRPWRPTRHLRVALRPHGHRLDAGMHLAVAGDVVAAVEFWLEDAGAGTLVHHLATVSGPTPRAARHWRRVVRRGLWALGQRLAAEVRSAVIVDPPGA